MTKTKKAMSTFANKNNYVFDSENISSVQMQENCCSESLVSQIEGVG